MDPCVPASICEPPSIGWSALILWTITIYGVLAILSIFAASIQWRAPTQTGARIARILSRCDLVSAAVAPVLVWMVLSAPRLAFAAVVTQLVLSIFCRTAARRPIAELPAARALR